MTRTCLPVLALAAFLAPLAARADWKPVERIETYAVSGDTGIALYRSIGARGPTARGKRAIAHTDYRLTWSRDYRPHGGGCTLASARPNLVITYRLPKPSGPLPPKLKKLWETFIAGIEAHERVHGAIIVSAVKKIEAMSVGLAVADDPDCSRTRAELKRRLVPIAAEMRRKNRDFDRTEMSEGGNVQQLILGLVNGG